MIFENIHESTDYIQPLKDRFYHLQKNPQNY